MNYIHRMTSPLKKPLLSIIIKLGTRKEKARFTDPPVLLGGCARSGTTLLLSILSSHEDIFACPREYGAFGPLEKRDGILHLARVDRLYRCILFNRVPATAKRWCEKTPINIRRVSQIDRYFKGNFRLIQIIRDGRDVILSRHPLNASEYWVSPERWVNDVSIGMEFSDHPNVYTVRYEDLINQYDKTIEGICNFLDLPLTERILYWHRYSRVRKTPALYSDIDKLSNRSIGKWKRPEHADRVKQLTSIPAAVELLKKFGYL
jgi:hypothetical protein